MGTRSTIAIENKDGTVNSVYCHWDGYMEHNGTILLCAYKDVNKIKKLISHGDISSLKQEIDFDGVHKYGAFQKDVCVFYARDLKENKNFNYFKSLKDYSEKNDFGEFNYIYIEKKKKWFLFNQEFSMFVSLEKEVKKVEHKLVGSQKDIYEEYLKEKKLLKEYKKLNKELEKKEENVVNKRLKM